MTPAYFAKVRPTYIENWSSALLKLSIPQTDIPLNPAEASALATLNHSAAGSFESDARGAIAGVVEKLDAAFSDYPDGAFVRLGSRSAKDSRFAQRCGLRVTNSEAVMRMLTEGSRRVAFDLRLALRHEYEPHIFLRQWYEIPAWAEFRCFMKSGKLIGISQYDCQNLRHCPEIAENAGRIKAAIEIFSEKVGAASHLQDVVFDVFINLNGENPHDIINVKLLELNPFIPQTDACLFDWDESASFDGSLRFL